VDSDNLAGAIAATEYLIGLEHRRIGFLGGRPDLESARLRDEGYRRALTDAGIPVNPELMRVAGYREETADLPARELLTMADPPTAIFAANDLSAIRTMDVARSLGLSVPENLPVIGFDNVPESALTTPPLTTINQPIQQMGFEAMKFLIDLINGTPIDDPHRQLSTKLVPRGSCRAL
jgi:LacI family transcriptional regulator